MKQLKLALVAAAAALFAVACATSTPTNTTINSGRTVTTGATPAPAATPAADEHAAARATFQQFCANCHKQNGEGGVVEFDEGVKITVPTFKAGHALGHTDEQFARKIANGDRREGMPAFKDRLTPEQIDGLVRFIRHEFQSGGAAGAGNANAGGH